jgi:hypothetical protein
MHAFVCMSEVAIINIYLCDMGEMNTSRYSRKLPINVIFKLAANKIMLCQHQMHT